VKAAGAGRGLPRFLSLGSRIRFLRVAEPSVDSAELLLLLQRVRERWWAAPEAATALLPAVPLTEADVARYCGRRAVVGVIGGVKVEPRSKS
jgi:hypothetical protein